MSDHDKEGAIPTEPELKNGFAYTGDKGPRFGARHVQVLIMATGLAFTFSTNYVFTSAVIAMTSPNTSTTANVPYYKFDNVNVMISAIMWSGFTVNILGGYLGSRFGPKWFIVISGLLNSIFFMLIPLMAEIWGSTGIIFCRIMQGLQIGLFNPLNGVIAGRWIPPEERSRVGYLDTGVIMIYATVITIASGAIAGSSLGWPAIFYIFGSFTIVWCLIYAIFGAQSVETHKSITPQEKLYIQTTLGEIKKDKPLPTPWVEIFTNIHVWASFIGSIGGNWLTTLLSTEVGIFMQNVLEFDLQKNVLIVGLPSFISLFMGVIIALLSDAIPQRGILRLVNSRRAFQLIGVTITSLSLISLTYVPVAHRNWSVVFVILTNIFILCSGIGGAGTNLMDVAVKYAGVTSGFGAMLSQFTNIFAPLTVQWICTDIKDASQWRLTFILAAIIAIGCSIFFAIFASDQQQFGTNSYEEEEIETSRKSRRLSNLSVAGTPIVPNF